MDYLASNFNLDFVWLSGMWQVISSAYNEVMSLFTQPIGNQVGSLFDGFPILENVLHFVGNVINLVFQNASLFQLMFVTLGVLFIYTFAIWIFNLFS